jgi:Mitochondrial large subunit ribosomal protein (Img2)
LLLRRIFARCTSLCYLLTPNAALRKDGTKIVTRIKKVTGDMDIFLRELRIVLSLPQPANQLPAYDSIRLRTGNMIEIQGHRANEVRDWLGGLGF